MSASSSHGQLTESLSCPICVKVFNDKEQKPLSLGCGHTVCRVCLIELEQKKCPYDNSTITKSVHELPVNFALLGVVGKARSIPEKEEIHLISPEENASFYESCKRCIEDLAANINCITNTDEIVENECENIISQNNSIFSRPMQRKLVSLINCQLVEEEGRARALRAARSLGERTVVELILQHQNPQQLSANLWAAVRARGCQFLGPEMQEEVLKLILLALEDGSALARKVLVLFVVQKLEATFTQASKTAIGHVVQLLYRASCFKVTKKDDASSLMQLKDEFRSYDALRREHDSQIVQIAMEAALRISPEQWSSLLYGDPAHKSHMQSIIDKLQTPQSFSQSVNELMLVLQRTSDPRKLYKLQPHLEILTNVDICPDKQATSWENLYLVLKSLTSVVQALLSFLKDHNQKRLDMMPIQNVRYKTSMCRDFSASKNCPRGSTCTFAHSEEELERYRFKKKFGFKSHTVNLGASADLHIKKNEDTLMKRFADSKIEDHTSVETEKLRKAVDRSKSSLVTNVVKPMILVSATGTVCLSTDTTTSIATSASITSVSTSNQTLPSPTLTDIPMAHSLSSFPVQPDVYGVYNPSTAYYTPMVAKPGSSAESPPQLQQSYVRPTGSAARYPVSSPFFQPGIPYHMDTQQHSATCAHSYNGYVCDRPPHFAQLPGIAHYHPENSALNAFNEPSNSLNLFIEPHRETIVEASSGLGMTQLHSQQPILTANMTDQQFSNQANSLYNLQCRREEILSQIHNNIQMTAVFKEASGINRPNSQLSAYRDIGAARTTDLTSKGSNSGRDSLAQSINVANGLSQTEKAYTILKKELSRNPVQAPNPQELSWPTPTNSVSVLEFQNQILKAQLNSSDQDKCFSEALQSGNFCGWEETKGTSDVSDMDIEVDGCQIDNYRSRDYHQWSTFDMTNHSSEKKLIEDTVQYHGTNLLEWFQKSSAADQDNKNDVDDFIPFDPPIVSKFGPISRVARFRIKNSDPVIVTADKEISKMTPVTAVTPMQRPYPVSAPVLSRYKVPGQKINSQPDSPPTKTAVSEPHTLWHQHVSHAFKDTQHLHKELNRLEQNATGARTHDERLAYELKAIELKISMQTGKRPGPVDQPDIEGMKPPPSNVSSISFTPKEEKACLRKACKAYIERGDELSNNHQRGQKEDNEGRTTDIK